MDPHDPLDAQQVVIEYAQLLERDINEGRHPARSESLPYGKPTIKAAIRTSVRQLARTGQLTEEMRQYLETAYTFLSEYVDDEELVDPAAGPQGSGEKMKAPAWRTAATSGSLAGEIARTTTQEAEKLRNEFRAILTSV